MNPAPQYRPLRWQKSHLSYKSSCWSQYSFVLLDRNVLYWKYLIGRWVSFWRDLLRCLRVGSWEVYNPIDKMMILIITDWYKIKWINQESYRNYICLVCLFICNCFGCTGKSCRMQKEHIFLWGFPHLSVGVSCGASPDPHYVCLRVAQESEGRS